MSEWLGFAGVCITAYVAWQNGRIHRLVNSRFSEVVAEVASLRRRIANLTGNREDAALATDAEATAQKKDCA